MTIVSPEAPHIPDLTGEVESLIRRIAAAALDPSRGVLAEVELGALRPIQAHCGELPSLAEEAVAATRQNVEHWLVSLQVSPLTPVEPALEPSVLGIARSLLQRGAARAHWASYSEGREALWRAWMRIAFELAPDPGTLNDALVVSGTSLSRWVDRTICEVTDRLEEDAGHQGGPSHELRFQTVRQVLDGGALDEELVSYRLRYPLDGEHVGTILWTDPARPDQGALRDVAGHLAAVLPGQRSLSVLATSSSAWVWSAPAVQAEIGHILAGYPEVRAATGAMGRGVDGFRQTHREAMETQRLMLGRPEVRCAAYDEVSLPSLLCRDPAAARAFVTRVLGDLGRADAELRETVRVYITCGYNGSRTAEAVYAHRNTVFHRIQRAEDLLPRPLSTNGIEVATALELLRWLPATPST